MGKLTFSEKSNLKLNIVKNLIKKFKKNKIINKKNFLWDYISNPFGSSKFIIAKYDNLILGMIVCFPQVFINNKKKFSGYRIQDVITDVITIKKLIKQGVDVKKKNKGIFENLIFVLNNFLKKNSEINLGFANHIAVPYWRRNNWDVLMNFPLYEKKLSAKKNLNLKFKQIYKFNKKHENCFIENLTDKIDIFWNKKYSNWRYFKNPRAKYDVYEAYDKKKLVGYVVLKIFSQKNEKTGHICQIVSVPNLQKELINFSNNFFVKNKCFKMNMWSTNAKILNKLKFKENFPESKKIVFKSSDIKKKYKFNFSMGFSDTY